MEKTIDELIQDLKSTDEFVKEEAVGLLEFNAKDSLEPLIKALNDSDKEIRKGAAHVLGIIGDSKAIEPLIKTLSDKNKLVRREASTALSHMGKEAVDPLIKTLQDPDWKVRGAAVWALGAIGDSKAVNEVEKLLNDEKNFVVVGARYALDKLTNKKE
jgi:bilin biosynthesis protein